MRLSPMDIAAGTMRAASAHAYFFLDRYDEAITWANKVLQDQPDSHPALRIGVASAAFAGLNDLTAQFRNRLQVIDPEFSLSRFGNILAAYRRPEFVAKYTEGLRRGGFA